ncbi:substrate-binding domain-containing protein [Rhodobacteraceae bacterium XHP0102]|nr:substrate-binding domain-containing protein [Rhodobacteraceae bacterium XHP0102]
MRLAYFALGLSLSLTPAAGFEPEDHLWIEGSGDEVLRILSTADLDVFTPYLMAFHAENPSLDLDYTVVSSTDLYSEIHAGGVYDVVISSAMDLQFQLANDGLARRHRSPITQNLPDWAQWREVIFAFTTEPAVVLISTEHFDGLEIPQTRQELITILRDNPERFTGAIGTYDVRDSGLGYLFATQEDRATDAYWRLSEVMGRLQPALYCCSGPMIEDVMSGKLALAYNVLGSYAAERLADQSEGRVQILRMTDFSNVILRTALIPNTAPNPTEAGAFIDALLTIALRNGAEDWPLPPLNAATVPATGSGFGPIRLGPALMVYLDPLNRRNFLAEWENAILQQ